MSSANVFSPIQPRSRLATVTPSWVPEMNRVGLALARWTRRAARLPAAASWSIRVERDDTSANSVATKNPLAATRSRTMKRPVAGDIASGRWAVGGGQWAVISGMLGEPLAPNLSTSQYAAMPRCYCPLPTAHLPTDLSVLLTVRRPRLCLPLYPCKRRLAALAIAHEMDDWRRNAGDDDEDDDVLDVLAGVGKDAAEE